MDALLQSRAQELATEFANQATTVQELNELDSVPELELIRNGKVSHTIKCPDDEHLRHANSVFHRCHRRGRLLFGDSARRTAVARWLIFAALLIFRNRFVEPR